MRLLLFAVAFVSIGVKRGLGENSNENIKTCAANKDAPQAIINHCNFITSLRPKSHPKGYAGTIGIIGGSAIFAGSAYFAAMTSLQIGADIVKVFCPPDSGDLIKSYSPEISVYPILNKVDKVIAHLDNVDIVLLGPGLDEHTDVVPAIIKRCKDTNKPLVLHLHAALITKKAIDELKNYPENGVIILANEKEFKLLYEIIKNPKADSSIVDVNTDTFGKNLYILRMELLNSGWSPRESDRWIGNIVVMKRPRGEADMLAGAVATYYFLTLKHISVRELQSRGTMFRAGVATYAASTLIQSCNHAVFENFKRSMLTSDMLSVVSDKI